MTPATSDDPAGALRLYGTAEPRLPALTLRAGALSAVLQDGAIRWLRWHGVEVLRAVSYLLRDTQWGTAPGQVQQLQVREQADRFDVDFTLVMALPEGALTGRARISGTASGQFEFSVQAHSPTTLRTNRCGFLVLHPADAAGCALTVEHTDGALEHTRFPDLISPIQPVFDIRRLQHEPVAGLSVDCTLAAELPQDPRGKFEMEDQRNWSDASFKTYVCSLLDPLPYPIPAGATLHQQVRVKLTDTRAPQPAPMPSAPMPPSGPAPIRPGGATGMRMPAIGLGVPAGAEAITAEARAALQALRPAWLVAEVEVEFADTSGAADARLVAQLRAVAALALACGAQVQLDAICPAAALPEAAAAALARACRAAGCAPEAVRPCPAPYLKSYQPQGRWPQLPGLDAYARAFGAAFPGSRIGGGMLTSFTELNRKRPPAEGLQFIGHTTTPLVHAADEASIMESLQGLPHIVRSVRALWPGLAYRLGPVTLAMPRNPYAQAPVENPQHLRIAMTDDDPRHHGQFGAAWIAGYAATVAPLGLDLLALLHSHGRSGPLLRPDLPDWRPGACVPAWRVLCALARAAGAPLHGLHGLPEGIAGLAWLPAGGHLHILLANLQDIDAAVEIEGAWRVHPLSLGDAPNGVGQTAPSSRSDAPAAPNGASDLRRAGPPIPLPAYAVDLLIQD
jgi:hypothetical protein